MTAWQWCSWQHSQTSCCAHLSAQRLHVLLLHKDEDKAAGHQAPLGLLGLALRGAGWGGAGQRAVNEDTGTCQGSMPIIPGGALAEGAAQGSSQNHTNQPHPQLQLGPFPVSPAPRRRPAPRTPSLD